VAAPFASELLAINAQTGCPNCADKDSAASVGIAVAVLEQLCIIAQAPHRGQSAGSEFEKRVADHLAGTLPRIAPARPWVVYGKDGRRQISEFVQYEHLGRLKAVMEADRSGLLRVEIGADYLISPDVTVGLKTDVGPPFLHAAVSCKWTIRSDRVQNIRHEGTILTRHRRGRQPHIVAVTAEPLPTRLAAIARGTGEVDAVYHIALAELEKAVIAYDNLEQLECLGELLDQGRVRDFDVLAPTLALY
jgi:hypothetical protein